ncbi:hypothetical protein CDG79_27175 [Nostoc sp. 'Peltigera membranacea cyanobiont' 232]|nr:hypothetical protein CDG79_27175 [Nostoc sp. 'Peltigera membranacea cyanobiont' 232]
MKLNKAQEELMINQAIDIIFVDSFAFAINVTVGTLLHSKICNYSWEGKVEEKPQLEEISSNLSISTPSSEKIDEIAPVLSKYSKVNAKMKAEALGKKASTSV